MTPQAARANLRNSLADLYPSEADARRIAADAALNDARIVFSGTALNTWHSILREAERSGRAESLLAVVQSEYGENPKLAQAIDAYRTLNDQAGLTLSPPDERSAPGSRGPVPWTTPVLIAAAILLTAALLSIGSGRWNILHWLFGQAVPTSMGSLQSPPSESGFAPLPSNTPLPSPSAESATETPLPTTTIPSTRTPAPTATANESGPSATQTLEAKEASSQAALTAIVEKYEAANSGILAQMTPNPDEPQAGITRTNAVDGALYVFVPAGVFVMGEGRNESILNASGFWIMQTEVTNAHYARCVEAAVCDAPQNERWNDPAYADHPVTHIDWFQANTYAEWAGGRLPTEAEWEKACRGIDAREYPWGNAEPTEALLNFNHQVGDTTPAGHHSPQGDSPYGIADLAGNVWEWTADWYDDEQVERTLRGGAYGSYVDPVRCSYRFGYRPVNKAAHYGFRVASSFGP